MLRFSAGVVKSCAFVAFAGLNSVPSISALQPLPPGSSKFEKFVHSLELNTTMFIIAVVIVGVFLLSALAMSIFYIYKCCEWRKEKKKVEAINKFADQQLEMWAEKFELAMEQLIKKDTTVKPVPGLEATTALMTKTKKGVSTKAPLHMMTKSGKERLHYGRDIPREALVQKIVVSDDAPEKISRTLAEETQDKKMTTKKNLKSVNEPSIQLPSAAKYNSVPPPTKGKNNSVSYEDGSKSRNDVDASLSLTKGDSDFKPKKLPSVMTLQLQSKKGEDFRQTTNNSQDSAETEDVQRSFMPTE